LREVIQRILVVHFYGKDFIFKLFDRFAYSQFAHINQGTQELTFSMSYLLSEKLLGCDARCSEFMGMTSNLSTGFFVGSPYIQKMLSSEKTLHVFMP
jgi:hypothetical protein